MAYIFSRGSFTVMAITAVANNLGVVYLKRRCEQRLEILRFMAFFTHIAGANVFDGLADCTRTGTIVAEHTPHHNSRMTKRNLNKRGSRRMTNITLRRRRNMVRRFAFRQRAVVTTATTSDHLSVIHLSLRYFPTLSRLMTGLASI